MQFKSFIFLAALTGLILAAGYYLGGQQGVVTALVISAVMNVGSYWFSDKLVLAIYRARPLAPEQNLRVHQIVERIAEKTNLPKPKIYIVNMPAPNAFATGRNKNHAVVAVTPSILSLLNDKELEGVLAHELGHIQNKDILISSIAATLAGTISFLAQMAYYGMLFSGRSVGGQDNRNRGNSLGTLALLILTPIIATILHLAISRSREYLADATGARTTGDPEGLASALEKISLAAKTRPLIGEPKYEATAHLFIVNPFKPSLLMQLFSTHPPVEERIKRLRNKK